MLSKDFADKIVEHSKSLDVSRRSLKALSSEILSSSKRAIFAYHRNDSIVAGSELEMARDRLKQGRDIVAHESRLAGEGIWRACQEEFAEASLFSQYVEHGEIGVIKEIGDDPEIMIGGISDLTGELMRRAVLLASEGKHKDVEQIFQSVREAVDFLLRMDLTGSLRSKTDQAKQNLRKLEEIRYDLAIRARLQSVIS